MAKEIRVILKEIEKARELYNMDKYIIIKINQEANTDNKEFEFQGMYNNTINSIELTTNLTVLNSVMKELNNGYVLNFDYEIF